LSSYVKDEVNALCSEKKAKRPIYVFVNFVSFCGRKSVRNANTTINQMFKMHFAVLKQHQQNIICNFLTSNPAKLYIFAPQKSLPKQN